MIMKLSVTFMHQTKVKPGLHFDKILLITEITKLKVTSRPHVKGVCQLTTTISTISWISLSYNGETNKGEITKLSNIVAVGYTKHPVMDDPTLKIKTNIN